MKTRPMRHVLNTKLNNSLEIWLHVIRDVLKLELTKVCKYLHSSLGSWALLMFNVVRRMSNSALHDRVGVLPSVGDIARIFPSEFPNARAIKCSMLRHFI